MKTLNRLFCTLAALFMILCLCACGSESEDAGSTAPAVPAVTAPQIDPDVSDVLRSFYQNDLPAMALRCGLQDKDGKEIRCDISMLQKSVFVDFDEDGQKEIVLLYDVSARSGVKNRDVIVFVDEQEGAPVVVSSKTGSYGASKDDEAYILTSYNARICNVRFINTASYEAAVIETFENGSWKTDITAYHHITDHDGVKLENDSCYIDHAGGDLLDAVQGKKYYSKEKFVNFRTPNENYNGLITALLAETLLP